MKYTKTGLSVLDFIENSAEAARKGVISLNDFTEAMQSGDRKRMEQAVERMYDAGGYDCLE